MKNQDWTDRYYWSRDGLRLHYRDYDGPADRPALLCLPGLTRNCRDFEAFAADHAGRFRLIALSLRGRGDSAYAKDSLSYVPLTYVQDVEALLEAAGVRRFAAIGTSLGGLLTMMLAPTHRDMLAGALLNDIGPMVEPLGLERIRAYVGRSGSWPTWLHAAKDLARLFGDQHPDDDIHAWLATAKRQCRVSPAGRIVWDYDARIAEPFRLPHGDGAVDLWPAFAALAGKPVLSVRGAHSDILSAATQTAMAARLPGLVTLTVPHVGHAPTLSEAVCQPAIADWLDAVAAR